MSPKGFKKGRWIRENVDIPRLYFLFSVGESVASVIILFFEGTFIMEDFVSNVLYPLNRGFASGIIYNALSLSGQISAYIHPLVLSVLLATLFIPLRIIYRNGSDDQKRFLRNGLGILIFTLFFHSIILVPA